eukprot:300489_1
MTDRKKMSWSCVVQSNSNKDPKKLLIKHNIHDTSKQNCINNDGIPRHKEITPDPADDFVMTNQVAHTSCNLTNVEKNKEDPHGYLIPSLTKELNPYSLQCLIDWVYNIEQNNKIIELDFDKMEKDIQSLKEKYGWKCKGLFYPNIIRHIDGNGPDSDMILEKQKITNKYDIYTKLFARNTKSIIHYILNKPDFEQKQVQKQSIYILWAEHGWII